MKTINRIVYVCASFVVAMCCAIFTNEHLHNLPAACGVAYVVSYGLARGLLAASIAEDD